MQNDHCGELRIANEAQTPTHQFTVGTSERDGHMYLVIQERNKRERARMQVRLTEENRGALAKVLGPTEAWRGILG